MRTAIIGLATALSLSLPAAAADLAFPGAVGYGKVVKGGRGGKVFVVSNRNDAGPGSLRECMDHVGPRHCVLAVTGVIATDTPFFTWESRGKTGNISIWGQASPGGVIITQKTNATDGRTPFLFADLEQVIIQNIRVHGNYDPAIAKHKQERSSKDCITFERMRYAIVDHVSCRYAADEGFNDFQGGRFITYSHNLVHPGLTTHPYGQVSCSDAHRALTGVGCGSITWFGNAFHRAGRRSPNMKTAGGQFGPHDMINNLVSEPGEVGAEIHDDHPAGPDNTGTWANVVGNYAQAAALNPKRALINESNYFSNAENVWFARDNLTNGRIHLYRDNVPTTGAVRNPTRTAPVAPLSVSPMPASQTKAYVLKYVGAWPRDSVDAKVVADMTPTVPRTTQRLTKSPAPPTLTGPTVPADQDKDGIADSWEQAHGLDPSNPADSVGDGTAPDPLEVYMAELMANLLPD